MELKEKIKEIKFTDYLSNKLLAGYSPKKLLLQMCFHAQICEKTPLISHQAPLSIQA